MQTSLTVCLFFLTSIYFLLGRIQLGSLFKTERSLVGNTAQNPQINPGAKKPLALQVKTPGSAGDKY